MTAWPESRRSGFLAAVAARAEAWLLEPAPARSRPAEPEARRRPVVAVVALARRSGATTIARALAVELARRDRGTAIVSTAAPPRMPLISTATSRRLARIVHRAGEDGARPAGRLCLVEDSPQVLRDVTASRLAPLVLDVRHGDAPETALALADRVVLVAGAEVLPALADVVAASLTRDRGPAPLVVVNRAIEPGPWADRPAILVGESKVGARMALAGRDPLGPLAAAMAELADLCESDGA